MRASPTPSARLRQLVLLSAVLGFATLRCGRDVTAPQHQPRVATGLAFAPHFPAATQLSSAAAGIVPFTRVRVLLQHSNGATALDDVFEFPAGSDELPLDLTVTLLPNAPADGEMMELTLEYINAAGDTVFRGGPISVHVVPSTAGPQPPVSVPVTYTGTGANASGVRITPRTLSVSAGGDFTFTATAVDANGTVIPGTPIVWSSLNPAMATLTSATAGAGIAQVVRGQVQIMAQLLTTGADTVVLTIVPRVGGIAAVSGNGQSGGGGVVLAQPLVVRVVATDGLPMAGATVTFTAANGGSVSAPTVTTDTAGLARTLWTLGPATGAQSLTATAAGLTSSPVSFSATSTSGPATKLVVTTQPVNGTAGGTLAPIVVAAQDAAGNIARSFTGTVSMALTANPGGATLKGATAVSAVAGVATFSALTLDKAGTGYTLTASAAGLTSATTSPFNLTVPPPVALGVLSGDAQTAPAGTMLPLPVVFQVVDVNGANVALAGRAVTFTIDSSGGSVLPRIGITDADGSVSVQWTLGTTPGTQSLTASSTGLLPAVATATATPYIGQLYTWLGSADSLWTNAANWSPNGVPGANDDVYVPSAPFHPSINAATSIRTIMIGGCSYVSVNSPLTVSGNLADSSNACVRAPAALRAHAVGTFPDTASVVLTGDGTVMGSVDTRLVIVGGVHTMAGSFDVNGSLAMSGTSRLVVNGNSLGVGGSFTTSGGATLQMTNSADFVSISGTAAFAGGSESGLLTAGLMYLYGDFVQGGPPAAFAASGTHTTILAAGGTQGIAFTNPSTSFFGNLDFANNVTMALSTDVTVSGTLANSSGFNITISSVNGNLLTVSGLSYGAPSSNFTNVRLRYTDGVPGAATFNNVAFTGFGPGATFLDFNRTAGTGYNFANLSFNGTLNTTGRYIANSGTVLLTLTTPSPNAAVAGNTCLCTTWFTPGVGGIIW